MTIDKQQQRLKDILAEDSRFRQDAYLFVGEAVAFTMAELSQKGQTRHISGGELLEGIRKYALEQFGPLTLDVLQDWGVNSCADFGDIVFHMVEHNLLGASEEDSQEDFRPGYDFREAFLQPFIDDGENCPDAPLIA